MSRISRRDFLKLFLAAFGATIVFLLQKLYPPATVEPEPTPTPTPFQPPVRFFSWGQDDLAFAELTVPYQNLG